MTRAISRPRRSAGAAPLSALLLAGTLLLAACSPSAPSATGAAQASTSTGPASAASSAAASVATPSTPADRLAAAFAALAGGYTYQATVTVGGATVSTATGRSVGGASEFTLTTNGATVVYRAIPPSAWVQRESGGPWVQVVGYLPPGSPLDALTKPTSTTVVSDTADALVVDAAYPAAALGLTGKAAVTVRLTASSSGSLTAAYQTNVGSDQASSATAFTPASGLAPISAP